MFAVIKTGGKQYRVAPDDVITVDRIEGEAGASLEIAEVLMLGNDAGIQVGAPLVEGARVAVEIVEQARGEKVIAFKKRRRKNSKRKRGFRADLTVLRITSILAAGESGEKKKRASRAKAPAADAAPADAAGAEAAA